MILTLFCISCVGGFLSGFLGIGGAVVMIPMMLSLPPLLGAGQLGMKSVAGLSMIQVLFASISGLIIHKKNRFIHFKSLLYLGLPMGLLSLLGSYFSKHLENTVIMLVFGVLTLVAFFLLLFYKPDNGQPEIQLENLSPNPLLSIFIGAFVGLLSGIVGAGGGFILIPLMVTFLKMPLKITVGTSLGIVFIGAFFGALGKILSMQVEYLYILPVVAGSLLAARFGAKANKKVPSKTLKNILLFVILISLIQMVLNFF